MPFITQGPEGEQAPYGVNKTNLKYILIVIILAGIVGGGVLCLQYWLFPEEPIKSIPLPPPVKKLKTTELSFTLPSKPEYPLNVQAVISLSGFEPFGNPITDEFHFSLIHPDGRIIEPPVIYDDASDDIYNLFEKPRKSFRIQSEGYTLFKLFPGDPLVEPIRGDWKVRVITPEDTHFVFGVTAW